MILTQAALQGQGFDIARDELDAFLVWLNDLGLEPAALRVQRVKIFVDFSEGKIYPDPE